MNTAALRAGLELTVAGMGLVFLLLAMLWAMIAVLLRTDRPGAAPVSAPPPDEGAVDAQGLSPALVAAVMVAVRLHRHVQRRRAAPAMRAHRPGTLPNRWVIAGRTRQNRSWAPGGRFT